MARRTARSRGRQCLAEGCERNVRPGRAVCGPHGRTDAGREIEAATRRLAHEAGAAVAGEEAGPAAVAAFGRALARGEYGAAFDDGIREAMTRAVAELGVAEEIGALRLTLARLMAELVETEDPVRLAHSVARVASASVRAVERQKALTGGPSSELQAAMLEAIAELDAEQAAKRAAGYDFMAEFRVPGWVPPDEATEAELALELGLSERERAARRAEEAWVREASAAMASSDEAVGEEAGVGAQGRRAPRIAVGGRT